MNNIYLVRIAASRTGKRRSYRAFSITEIEPRAVIDVTSGICKRARLAWNNKTGALEMSEPYVWQDGAALAARLDGFTVTVL